MTIQDDIKKRRTFAIISHPDAGKTTITEQLLYFGGEIREAGTVKGKVMAAVDSHGEQSGKRYKNRTERMIDREKRNMKNTKKFWSNESMSITSDIRDEILSVSEEFDD